MAETENTLSIIIVNWKTTEFLNRCINSIYINTKKINFEIIVIDNESNNDTDDILKYHPEIILIKNPENLGYAKGCNQGIKEAKGMFVLLLNPDTIIHDSAFDNLIKFAEKQENVAIIGSIVLNKDGVVQMSCKKFPKLLGLKKSYKLDNISTTLEVDWVVGACLLVRKDILEEENGLDENFLLYSEDLDLCYRIREKGWKIFYYPGSTITHIGNKSTEKLGDKKVSFGYGARIRFYKKHFSNLHAFIYRLTRGLSCLLRIIILPKKFKKAYWYALLVCIKGKELQ